MPSFKKFAAILISGTLLFTGCNFLPSPSSTIGPPTAAQVGNHKELEAIVREFLPPEANQNSSELTVTQTDVDADGQKEIITVYEFEKEAPEIGALALKLEGGRWKKVWQEQGFGYDLDVFEVADITGDGKPEVLIGTTIGASAGNGLDIFSWHEGTLKKIATTGYHRLEIIAPEKENKEDSKRQVFLAVWQKDTGNAMAVDVLRWEEIGLVPAEDLYPKYFPKVVEYYEEQLKKAPDAPVLWYYLADAQQKAGMPEEALKSVEKGLDLKGDYPPEYKFKIVQAKALNDLGEYQKAISLLNEVMEAKEPMPPDSARQGEPAFLKKTKAEALIEMGKSYEGLKQYDKAEDCYRESLEITKSLFQGDSIESKIATISAKKALQRLKSLNGEE